MRSQSHARRLAAASLEAGARGGLRGTKRFDDRPHRGDLGRGECARGEHAWRPDAIAAARDEMERRLDLADGPSRRGRIEIGLVDDDEIGQIHHALLDRLQIVARVRQLQQHEHVGHAGDRRFALADADGLDHDDVEARRLDDADRLARRRRDAAERAAARARPDEGAGVDREPLHACLVAEDRAAPTRSSSTDRSRGRRPSMTGFASRLHPERRRRRSLLPTPGTPVDSDAKRRRCRCAGSNRREEGCWHARGDRRRLRLRAASIERGHCSPLSFAAIGAVPHRARPGRPAAASRRARAGQRVSRERAPDLQYDPSVNWRLAAIVGARTEDLRLTPASRRNAG